VRFVKERTSERRHLYYVTFDGVMVLDDQRAATHFAWVFRSRSTSRAGG
jgi:hypothetical protein